MKIWMVCFLALFAIAELFDWIKQFNLPLPIYILGGAFLAIASNYNKLVGSSLHASPTPTVNATNQPELSPAASKPVSFTISRTVKDAPQPEIAE
ncbi:MAG: hypothetical protein H0X31_21335 [Nostocaceae cyanobacterium]|nr:hypothetical protein [Nostocaceae cyanobacterium]